jgi:hypothetical protein
MADVVNPMQGTKPVFRTLTGALSLRLRKVIRTALAWRRSPFTALIGIRLYAYVRRCGELLPRRLHYAANHQPTCHPLRRGEVHLAAP